MDFSASTATKDAVRVWRRRSCTPPRSSSTLPVAEHAAVVVYLIAGLVGRR
jgi:hypothetical protein